METLIEGLKIAVVLWSYVFWGIGLWVTILVSSQLRDSIDHRGESLTVPHPRRVSTPFLSLWSSTSFLSSPLQFTYWVGGAGREFAYSPLKTTLL